MSELAETTQFLEAREPFSLLPRARVAELARRAVGSYVRRGTIVLAAGDAPSVMHLVRSGALEVLDLDGEVITNEEQGACFGHTSILEGRPSRFTFTALEDSLLWSFDADVVAELAAVPEVRRFFTESRLADAARTVPEGGPILHSAIADMITRAPITIDVASTVGQAAQRMDETRVSAIIVTSAERLAGIVTDRDLRRVVARGLPYDTALVDVMSADPHTIPVDSLALDALLELVEHTIHHLPVLDGDEVVGMITSGDLMRLERSSPLYLAGDLQRQGDVAGLAAVMRRLPTLVARLLEQDASAEDITRVISRTTEALWRRLAHLAEAELGAPPVPYCWVALGSLARQEQALSSDQDHAFITSDEATDADDEYFATLAQWLTSALVTCGFPRCAGDAMATNPRWRGPLRRWVAELTSWLRDPTADAVLNSSIFFDLRAVHGASSLADELAATVRAVAPSSTRFLGHLASHAGDIEVPIGFLRGFVVEKRGSHRDRLDIKLGGITPIVDVARVYALRWGLPQVSTRARLSAAAEHGVDVSSLLDAQEFLAYTRLAHQGRMISEGKEADNFIDPNHLSDFERGHLREAFTIVRRAQTAVGVALQTQYM